MEKAWEAMPARIRKAASDVVNPTECAQGRWFADNDRNGVWDVLLIGPQRSVFVSGQQDTKPVRYTFAYVTDTLETKELKQLAPTQPNPPQKGSRVGGSHSEEPWEWFRDLSNLPYRVQDVVRFSLPASVKGLRWSGGFCTNDRAEETLAVFAATRKLMVYTWGHRQVAADPFGQTMTTDQRRRAAPRGDRPSTTATVVRPEP
jgi:hypothetical protein